MNKDKVAKVVSTLETAYPNAKPALKFDSVYELLVAVILSAQCTDERVNKVTEKLFRVANTPEKMCALSAETLEEYIYSCGLYKTKAQHILSASKDIIEKFDGNVPSDLENLRSLAGVGRKTANVVYAVGFNGNAIAVDTHVFRVSNRIGIAKGKTPLEVENGLMKAIDENEWSTMHHCLIWHGRKVCESRKPKCEICQIKEFCEYDKKEI